MFSTNPNHLQFSLTQETFSLLEAIELHKDDWIKVAEHVNNSHHDGERVRNHDDCIMAFLRLPIEDPYVEAAIQTERCRNEAAPFATTGLRGQLPLSSSAGIGCIHAPSCPTVNPVLSTLAFLARAVNMDVAAEGAVAATHALGEIIRQRADKGGAASMDTSADKGGAAAAAAAAPSGGGGGDGAKPKSFISHEELKQISKTILDSAGVKARVCLGQGSFPTANALLNPPSPLPLLLPLPIPPIGRCWPWPKSARCAALPRR